MMCAYINLKTDLLVTKQSRQNEVFTFLRIGFDMDSRANYDAIVVVHGLLIGKNVVMSCDGFKM